MLLQVPATKSVPKQPVKMHAKYGKVCAVPCCALPCCAVLCCALRAVAQAAGIAGACTSPQAWPQLILTVVLVPHATVPTRIDVFSIGPRIIAPICIPFCIGTLYLVACHADPEVQRLCMACPT